MTGQDAIKTAGEFNRRIGMTGIILSKMDGDARGGAALSMSPVVGLPMKFVGTGEQFENLEPFHPERVVSRILGMGDVLTLIERAEEAIDHDKCRGSSQRSCARMSSPWRLPRSDEQHEQAGVAQIDARHDAGMGMLKGAKGEVDEKEMGRVEAIINSMTADERDNHTKMNGSRRRRIARGSGTRSRKSTSCSSNSSRRRR